MLCRQQARYVKSMATRILSEVSSPQACPSCQEEQKFHKLETEIKGGQRQTRRKEKRNYRNAGRKRAIYYINNATF